jgi:hypothetical protein
MAITKTDAARRQLDTAIDLFFRGGDSIAVATLAYNALEIAAALAKRLGKCDWTTFKGVALPVNSTGEEIRAVFHTSRNLFEHAERDPDEVLEDPGEGQNEHLLAIAALQFGEVSDCTLEMWAALIWFYAVSPEFQVPDAMQGIVGDFVYLKDLGRKQQLEVRPTILAELRGRARVMQP